MFACSASQRQQPRLLALEADQQRVLHVEVLERRLEHERLRLAAQARRVRSAASSSSAWTCRHGAS